MSPAQLLPISLEVGKNRTIASAVAWPGWCRSGRNEQHACDALLATAPRYAQLLGGISGFPEQINGLEVIESLTGNATTDFGAPGVITPLDHQPLDRLELQQHMQILNQLWAGFDQGWQQARGKTLRKGPRGGGRELDTILDHVIESDRSYLAKLGGKPGPLATNHLQAFQETRLALLQSIEQAAARTEPAFGPRGGAYWPVRYAIRRIAWHVVDHLWEVEDRLEVSG